MDDLVADVQKCVHGAGGYVWVATADPHGETHLAVSNGFQMVDRRTATLSEWCCLRSVGNLRANKRLTVGVWDRQRNEGWQLICESQGIMVTGAAGTGDVADATMMTQPRYTIDVAIREATHLVAGQHGDAGL